MNHPSGSLKKSHRFSSRGITGILLVCLLPIFLVTSCDDPPGSTGIETSKNILSDFSMTPGDVDLGNDITGEETINYELLVTFDQNSGYNTPVFTVFDANTTEEILQGDFTETAVSGRLQGNFSITVPANQVSEFRVYVFSRSESGTISNTFRRNFRISGALSGPPVMEYLDHSASVPIPQTGTTPIRFESSVIHPDGQANIEEVLLELYDSNGVLLGGQPFTMDPESDDPGNNIFSRTFQINPQNQPETYDVWGYAIDRAGVSSDTLFSTITFTAP